jgi:hypothetical protein
MFFMNPPFGNVGNGAHFILPKNLTTEDTEVHRVKLGPEGEEQVNFHNFVGERKLLAAKSSEE